MQTRNFTEGLKSLVHIVFYLFLLIALVIALTWVAAYFNVYTQAIEVLKVVIWPLVIFIGIVFFQKVLTYLFFSFKEFNFFGARGRLKNVNEVIDEKVSERLEALKREGEIAERMHKLEEMTESLGTEDASVIVELINSLDKQLDYKDKEIESLKDMLSKIQNESLAATVATLQDQVNKMQQNTAE